MDIDFDRTITDSHRQLGDGTEVAEESVKRPYQKPEIKYRGPLEAMAATCTGPGGKLEGTCGVARS